MAKVSSFLLAVVTMTALPFFILAADYVVGDESGWNALFDYKEWVAGKTFYQGDVLNFNYDPNEDNVVQVHFDGFESCSTENNSGIYTSGDDKLLFPAPGAYFFISQYHCQQLFVYVNGPR